MAIILESPFLSDSITIQSEHLPRIGDKIFYTGIKYVVSDCVFNIDAGHIYLYIEECE